MPTPLSAGRLECGASTAQLLGQAAENGPRPQGSHQLGCTLCQAALAELASAWGPVRQWATASVRAPVGLVGAVMAQVRRLAFTARHDIAVGPRGHTTVSIWVLEMVAGTAALEVPGVLALGTSARRVPRPAPGPSSSARRPASPAWPPGAIEVTLREGAARVRLDIVVAPDVADINALAEQVRGRARHHLQVMAGLDVDAVDVQVADVGEPGATAD